MHTHTFTLSLTIINKHIFKKKESTKDLEDGILWAWDFNCVSSHSQLPSKHWDGLDIPRVLTHKQMLTSEHNSFQREEESPRSTMGSAAPLTCYLLPELRPISHPGSFLPL